LGTCSSAPRPHPSSPTRRSSDLVLIYGFVSQRTIFGRHIYAMGGNLQAAQLSGVKTRWVNMWLFVHMGLLSAIAGIVYSARSNRDRKSTRLNSSQVSISYAVFCL